MFDSFFAWSHRLSRVQLQVLAAVAFLVAAVFVAFSIPTRQTALRKLATIPGGVWLLLVWLMLFGEPGNSGAAAVVIVPEVMARSADSVGAPARLPEPLPGGTELEIVESRDGWTRVRLFDGRDAWLATSAVQLVNGPSGR
jgi:hypothetical protein